MIAFSIGCTVKNCSLHTCRSTWKLLVLGKMPSDSDLSSDYEDEDLFDGLMDDGKLKWYEKNILSCFIFPEKDSPRIPFSDENIRGECRVCGIKISGRIAANGNFSRHYVIGIF